MSPSGNHAIGDCPFCGREGKFSVEVATGLWRCFVCGSGSVAGGGNGLTFTRLLYERATAAKQGAFPGTVAKDRRLLSPGTVAAWGVAQAADGAWLVPGYGTDGKLDQVYRRVKIKNKDGEWEWRLLPTPGIWPEGKVHALHLPLADFDPVRPNIVVCEGPWDGMALWEVWASDGATNIVAVPGCNVWRDEWTQLCKGKFVTLMFDSDHLPTLGGYKGMERVAKRLSGVAAAVAYLKWGPDGYSLDRPTGWDVRDELSAAEDRKDALKGILARVELAPREWFNHVSSIVNGQPHHGGSAEAAPCSTWAECSAAWGDAIRMRQDLTEALSVVLAVCASTAQSGNQLFLDLIGSPGSAKTTLCQGLLVSGHCVHLENVTKLVSGWKKPGDEEKDCSFLARSNNKTWVTCEFDVLGASPEYNQLMGKVRRIFDGETSTTYGNDDKDRVYVGLRTPWIRAGTPRMMDRMSDHDQSQLGDRFLRFIIRDPENGERREIARSALRSERLAMVDRANGTSGSIVDAKTRRAHALTGGYVDWLRANVEEKLTQLVIPDYVEDYCIDLAELSADLRARPSEDRRKVDVHDVKEMPTRLARQNIRMASCLAVVMNRGSIDQDVLRVVRKVAMDTAIGHTQSIVQWLCSPNPRSATGGTYNESGGLGSRTLETWTGMSPDRMDRYLKFLRKIDVLDWKEVKQSAGAWALTERVYQLYLRVMGGK